MEKNLYEIAGVREDYYSEEGKEMLKDTFKILEKVCKGMTKEEAKRLCEFMDNGGLYETMQFIAHFKNIEW